MAPLIEDTDSHYYRIRVRNSAENSALVPMTTPENIGFPP